MKIYTKDSLISELKEIAAKGWIENARHGNAGGIRQYTGRFIRYHRKQFTDSECSRMGIEISTHQHVFIDDIVSY